MSGEGPTTSHPVMENCYYTLLIVIASTKGKIDIAPQLGAPSGGGTALNRLKRWQHWLLPLEVLRRCQDGWFVASNYHPGEASEEGGVDKDYLFLHNFNRYYWVVIAPTTLCRYDREKKIAGHYGPVVKMVTTKDGRWRYWFDVYFKTFFDFFKCFTFLQKQKLFRILLSKYESINKWFFYS